MSGDNTETKIRRCRHGECQSCTDHSIRGSDYYVCCQCWSLHAREGKREDTGTMAKEQKELDRDLEQVQYEIEYCALVDPKSGLKSK